MGNTIYSGISQLPGDFDKSRLAPEVRAGLAAQSPEIREGIRRIADAAPDQGRQDNRADWRQLGGGRR